LVMGNIVNRQYEPVLAQAGDTVNVVIPPVLVANNVSEAGAVQNQNPNLGNAQIVLNTHAEATFNIPDATRVLAVPDLLRTYLQPAVIAIAERIETDLLGLYTLLTANAAVGAGTTIDEARVDLAETNLFNAKVPASEPLYLVLSGPSYGSARQLGRFSEYQTLGPQNGGGNPIPTGVLGRLKNFQVARSQYVTFASNYKNVAFARDAFGLIIRRLPQPIPGTGAIAEYAEMGNFGLRVVMSYAPNTLAQQFTVDVLYGVSVLRNNFGVVVLST
jgi:hypothetical protein